jgi:hypothetical protein
MKIRTKLLLIILPVVLLVMLAAAFGGRQLVLDQAQNQLFSRAEAMAIAHANQHELQVRQTLAMTLGLQGKMGEAEQILRRELPPELADQNLAWLAARNTPAWRGICMKLSLSLPIGWTRVWRCWSRSWTMTSARCGCLPRAQRRRRMRL